MLRTSFDDLPAAAFRRLPAVMALCGLKRSAIYAHVKKGDFPAPEKLTLHASGWRVGALRCFLENPAAWRAGANG